MQTRTRRQREIYEYVVDYIERHGHQPSYQMIARHFGVASRAGIGKHIRALETQGLILRLRVNGSFKLQVGAVARSASDQLSVAWFDRAAVPDDDEQKALPFAVPPFMLGSLDPTNLIAFRVDDDSMSGRNIVDGDVVLIERRAHARDGDLILASIRKDPPMLRSFFREGSKVELRSAHVDFPTERLSGDNVEIHGLYRGLFRPAA
jgi:repressor LexA